MTFLQALVLALVQGATEFLPVSSSAHLILVPRLLGWPDQGLAFDIAVHTGTLLAVVLYFRQELQRMGVGWIRSLGRKWTPEGELAWALILGTAPVAVAGLFLQDFVATGGRSPLLIAGTSMGFGLLLGWADLAGRRTRSLQTVGFQDALVVGLAQALALIPGTSRSGITITAGLFLGLDRRAAARFSFLLAIPVGVLVTAQDLLNLWRGRIPGPDLLPMATGLLLSALAAYLVIHWLLAWLQRRSLLVFVVYRVLLGGLILALPRL